MATKVKPTRLNVTGTPQVGRVPTYVSKDTFAWGAGGGGGGASFGRFLSLWDSTTGQPISFPEATPYNYLTGDYFIVSVVSSATPPVNYRPDGSSYTGTASSTSETDDVKIGDTYVYDGSVWLLQFNNGTTYTASTGININSSNQISNTGVLSVNGNTGAVTVETPNTKAFYLSSTSDLTTAQAAYNWQNGGKTALIIYNDKPYTYLGGNAAAMNFKCLYPYEKSSNQTGKTELVQDALILSLSSGTVTSISANSRYNTISAYLNTNQNYTTPYTPQYDGSPATKKYVDDGLATKQDELVSTVNIRTINGTSILGNGDITTPTGIPSQTGEAGKFLTTDGTSVSWGTVSAGVTSVNGNTGAVTVREVPSVGTNGQVLTVVSGAAAWANAAGSDYSWVTKTISGGEIELGLRTIVNVPTSNFTLTAPATLKDGEEYAIRIISETSYTMTLGTGFTNPRNVDTTLSGNATDQYVFLAIGGDLELQPLVDTGA